MTFNPIVANLIVLAVGFAMFAFAMRMRTKHEDRVDLIRTCRDGGWPLVREKNEPLRFMQILDYNLERIEVWHSRVKATVGFLVFFEIAYLILTNVGK